MSQVAYGRIVLGPGGRITDAPENCELLERIRSAPVLNVQELISLAQFYKAFPTNVALGNHLELVALSNVEQPIASETLFAEYANVGDDILDLLHLGGNDGDNDEDDRRLRRVTPADGDNQQSDATAGETHMDGKDGDQDAGCADEQRFAGLFMRRVVVGEVALLIETLVFEVDKSSVNLDFVIGVAP